MIWRMTGSGPLRAYAEHQDGSRVQPTSLGTHSASDWDRPGDEWGSSFVLPSAGCWRFHLERNDVQGDIWVRVPLPESASYRTSCATDVLLKLAAAVNRGDAAALGTFFNNDLLGEHQFEWVSEGNIATPWAEYTPRGAIDHLLARYAAGERWTFTSVSALAGPSWHGGVDFSVRFERINAGSPIPSADGGGKGALSCISGRVYVLTL